jgi:predicted AlkP superfamily pyrophosphatase or phosphodiesterase
MKRLFPFFLLLLSVTVADAAPRLIIVLSFDQFRYDYLVRFREHLGKEGFRRLIDGGANFTSVAYEHANTTTGPGHAVILSGTYGWTNGIVANSWFDRIQNRSVYCVEDRSVRPVGGGRDGRSPANMIGATFGDQLRIASGFRSRVISVSDKDRAAVLMGGKSANGAYWMADSAFVSSSYYMDSLPSWVTAFNRSGASQAYRGKRWERALPLEAYAAMDDDDVPYEWGGAGLGKTFPHPITGDTAGGQGTYYDAMLTSPFGIDLLAKFALAAVEGEHLGEDEIPDLLCIGFSSTDLVGHAYGPNSQEVMDMAVQTDRILGGLLDAVDRRVGLRNTVIVVTADHGVTPIPEYLERRAPSFGAMRIASSRFKEYCESTMTRRYGPPAGGRWLLRLGHGTLYLNPAALEKAGVDTDAAAHVLADSLLRFPGIAAAVSMHDLLTMPEGPPVWQRFRRSVFPGRTGDLVYAFKPFVVMDDGPEGADHGAPYADDSHVPLVLFGSGIHPGTYAMNAAPIDLAPTLSALLGVNAPPASEGRVLWEALQPF